MPDNLRYIIVTVPHAACPDTAYLDLSSVPLDERMQRIAEFDARLDYTGTRTCDRRALSAALTLTLQLHLLIRAQKRTNLQVILVPNTVITRAQCDMNRAVECARLFHSEIIRNIGRLEQQAGRVVALLDMHSFPPRADMSAPLYTLTLPEATGSVGEMTWGISDIEHLAASEENYFLLYFQHRLKVASVLFEVEESTQYTYSHMQRDLQIVANNVMRMEEKLSIK